MKALILIFIQSAFALNTIAGDFCNNALINVTNKTSGKSTKLDLSYNKSAILGQYQLKLVSCWQNNSKYNLNSSKAYIELYKKENKGFRSEYQGWITKAPPHSNLFHDKLELILIECSKCNK